MDIIVPTINRVQLAKYITRDRSLPLLNFIIMYPGKIKPNVPVHDHPIKLIKLPKSLARTAMDTVSVTSTIRIV